MDLYYFCGCGRPIKKSLWVEQRCCDIHYLQEWDLENLTIDFYINSSQQCFITNVFSINKNIFQFFATDKLHYDQILLEKTFDFKPSLEEVENFARKCIENLIFA